MHGYAGEGSSPLDDLLRNETLPIDLDFYEALQASRIASLSGALSEAYNLAEEHYRILLGSSWIILNPQETSDILDELTAGPEIERMEMTDFFWSVESPSSVRVLRKLSSHNDDAGDFARLALLSQGHGSPKFALRILAEHQAKEMKLASLRALGLWLRGKQNPGVEKAIIETFEAEETELRLAAVQAAGIARMSSAWRPLKKLQAHTLVAKMEIEASLRAISQSQR
jgi:hypothetical protein